MHGRESEAVDESKGTAPKAMKQMSLNGAPLGMGKESPSCSEGETNLKGQTSLHMEVEDDLYSALSPIPSPHLPEEDERRQDGLGPTPPTASSSHLTGEKRKTIEIPCQAPEGMGRCEAVQDRRHAQAYSFDSSFSHEAVYEFTSFFPGQS